MADSNITKLALSNTLKELLEEQPFEKISVSDICERCHMNRKSFYYHFRDKFDLANWTFDTEFVDLIRRNELDITKKEDSFDERWKIMELICGYFYENRRFYRRLLAVEGQNSFSAHFRELIHPLIRMRITAMIGREDVPQMVCDFMEDGVVCSIERWLLDKNCIPVEEFMSNLKTLMQVLFLELNRRAEEDPHWLE